MEEIYKCQVMGCGMGFSTEDALKKHMKSEPFSIMFDEKKNLKRHLQTHYDFAAEIDLHPNSCKSCGMVLGIFDTVFNECDLDPNTDKRVKLPNICVACSGDKNSEDLLQYKSNFDAIIEKQTELRQQLWGMEYQCLLCPDMFDEKKDLERHIQTHSDFAAEIDLQPNICMFCGMVLGTFDFLFRHECDLDPDTIKRVRLPNICVACGEDKNLEEDPLQHKCDFKAFLRKQLELKQQLKRRSSGVMRFGPGPSK